MHFSIARRTAAIALLLAACDSSTGSEPLEGVYVAQSANGRPVPAVIDSLPWSDGTTYTLQQLVAASVEFLDDENARYTFGERFVTYRGADSLAGSSCRTVTLPYRRQDGRVILVVQPPPFGQNERLRLDTLQVQNNRLVQTIHRGSRMPVRVEFARAQQPAQCGDVLSRTAE